ncbi:MAG TPA: hypothetical protein VGO66_09565 [Solirubrobacterales bacterium]|jgi:hypothetical protein|nr:hypothetical protein [Solirubrobacterales bacterium]
MSEWPSIAEPELLKRLGMDDREFETFIWDVVGSLPARTYEAEVLARAVGYPWARPTGPYLLQGAVVEPLADLDTAERERIIDRFSSAAGERLPLLAIGSNAAPEVLERKCAHFAAESDRAVLVLTGRLHDFDVGVAPQPTMYGSMPATLFPSPGTAVQAALLWVTPAQFTQLAWSEITYRLGRLQTRFDVDESGQSFDEVLAFASRFGIFCLDGDPVALAAIPATGRTASALTQEQLLDAAAALAIEPGATAEELVRAIFEDTAKITPRIVERVHSSSQPFASQRWTPFSTAAPGKS